jgi:hypothetical protein
MQNAFLPLAGQVIGAGVYVSQDAQKAELALRDKVNNLGKGRELGPKPYCFIRRDCDRFTSTKPAQGQSGSLLTCFWYSPSHTWTRLIRNQTSLCAAASSG